MITFFFMNLIVGASAFLINYRILKLDNFLDSVLSLFILYFAQIVFTQLLLGVSGILYAHNIILFNLFLLLVVWFVTRNKETLFDPASFKKSLTGLSGGRALLLLTCVILGFGLTKIFVNFINPPFGWDSLNYHFVFPVEWLKHGNLENPITISDDPSPSYYPINGSLVFFWLMLPLKNVFLADLGQVPFFILSFLAVFNIARKAGLESRMSFYAAGLFFIVPNFFKQLSFAYVDVMVAALFLVCVNFLFLLNEKFCPVNILVYSMSLGLLLGTKTVALPYCILLLIPYLYLLFKNIKRFYLVSITIAAVFVLGGFSYIKDFFITGNPLYPLNLNLNGKVLLKGVMDSRVYRAHFKPEDYSLYKLLFTEGLGAQTVIFILPAVFLALPCAFIKKRKKLDFNLIYFLVLPVLIYLEYRYIIPLANARYLYPLLGVGIVVGFYTVKIFGVPDVIVNSLVAICTLASLFELAKYQELFAAIVFSALLFFRPPFLKKYLGSMRKPLSAVLFLILLIIALMIAEKNYAENEYKRYIKMVKYSGFWPDAAQAWGWLNSNTNHDNIAYVGRPVAFPLYGANFKNNVYYVSVNKTEPARLHDFPDSRYEWGYDFLSLHKNLEAPGNYRCGADYSVWLNNLAKRNTDYLFIYSLHQTDEIIFPVEDAWAAHNPDRFSLAFGNQAVRIYKILK